MPETLTVSAEDDVFCWRLHVLIRAGYQIHEAEILAESNTDLHKAVRLIEAGCPPLIAFRILV